MAALNNLKRLAAVLVLIATVFLVYWPAQRNGFVWDDTSLVTRDPLIRSWRLIPDCFQHFLFLDATASNFYRPLQRLSFLADYALWDLEPQGFHLSSIYAHLAAAIALYLLVAKLLPAPQKSRYALAVALLWAIHPLHTSAVSYVAGRADPLAAFFSFAALGLGLISLERGKRWRFAAAGAALSFLAALLSKESGIFALVVWFLLLALKKQSRDCFLLWGAIWKNHLPSSKTRPGCWEPRRKQPAASFCSSVWPPGGAGPNVAPRLPPPAHFSDKDHLARRRFSANANQPRQSGDGRGAFRGRPRRIPKSAGTGAQPSLRLAGYRGRAHPTRQ